MRFKETRFDSADLEALKAEADKEGKKESVWKEIADQFANKIPFMTRLPKEEGSIRVHYNGMANNRKMAEIISTMYPRRFPSVSHVYRAAECFMRVMYHQLTKGEDKSKDADFYKLLAEMNDDVLSTMQKIEEIEGVAHSLFKAKKIGIITEAEVENRIQKMIKLLPENAKRVAIERVRTEETNVAYQRRDDLGRFMS